MNAAAKEIQTVDLGAIRLDGDTQSREVTDPVTVKEYAELYLAGVGLPPVVLFSDGDDYWCADGHHRVEGARVAEFAEIDAIVLQGGEEEAALYGCGANKDHGLKRSPGDKRRAARRCMKLRPDWTDRRVADHVGIDHKTVASEREQAIAAGEIPHVEVREGKDGKRYPAKAAEPPAPQTTAEFHAPLDELIDDPDIGGDADTLYWVLSQLETYPSAAVARDAARSSLERHPELTAPITDERWDRLLEIGRREGRWRTVLVDKLMRVPVRELFALVELLEGKLDEWLTMGARRIALLTAENEVVISTGGAQIHPESWIAVLTSGAKRGIWEHSGVISAGRVVSGEIWLCSQAPASFGKEDEGDSDDSEEYSDTDADGDETEGELHQVQREQDPPPAAPSGEVLPSAPPSAPMKISPLIDLRCCDVAELLAELALGDDMADLVVADPAWRYRQRHGASAAADHYEDLSLDQIEAHLSEAAAVAWRLALWITCPLLGEWMARDERGSWGAPVTAGAWVKSGEDDTGHYGQGYHWAGCAELVLVYTHERAHTDRSVSLRNGWVEAPRGHSQKPISWQTQWVRRWVPPGGLVLDLYAGLGSVAEAVLLAGEGRRYIGAEIDPQRHAVAGANIEALCSQGVAS